MLELIIFFILVFLYWFCHKRRRYYKKRFKGNVWHHLRRTAKNIAFMLKPHGNYRIEGKMESLRDGAILYSFHFGIWELMPKILVRNGYRVGIIVNRYGDNRKTLKLIDDILWHIRSKEGVKVYYKEQINEIVKFLKCKGIFCALVDGNTFYAKYNKVAKLASLCKVNLIPFGMYHKNGIPTLLIGCNLIELLKENPYDYWWFYKSRNHE